MPTGNLGWAQAFESGWGYGVGFFTPALVPNAQYGTATIVTQFPLPGEVYPVSQLPSCAVGALRATPQ
jgi:hypothetical protein